MTRQSFLNYVTNITMRFFKTILISSAAILAFASAGCDNKGPENGPDDSNEIILNDTAVTLEINQTHQLEVLYPDPKEGEVIYWSSSDESVATVSETGLVTAIKDGSANITVSLGSLVSHCAITVNPRVIDFVEIDMTSMTPADVKSAIDKGLSEGHTNFKLIGPFENSGIPVDASSVNVVYDQNPFYLTNVEIIDLSEVTDWPEIDVDGQLDFDTLQPDLDGIIGLPSFAFTGMVTDSETQKQTVTYPNLKEVILPDDLPGIGVQAFYYNPQLTTVTAEGATHIGLSAFQSCQALTEVEFPSVTTIFNYAFAYSSVEKVKLPKATHFEYGAFEQCSNLVELSLTAAGDFTLTLPPYGTTYSFAFNFNTAACDLYLNGDKHFTSGNASPAAYSETSWAETYDGTPLTWKSITFER